MVYLVPTGRVSLLVVTTPLHRGRARSLEDGLNVHMCLGRGALPSATRGLAEEGLFHLPKCFEIHFL